MKAAYLLICSIIFISSAFSQIVYEPLNNDVYNYLHRLSQKGVIDFNDLVKPVSRKHISEKLIEAKNKIDQLTNLEKDELEFFEREYFLENSRFEDKYEGKENSGFFEKDSADRSRLFYYNGKILKLNVDPILGFEMEWAGKNRNTHSWNGLNIYGYVPGNIGLSLDFRINNENKQGRNRDIFFTPATGVIGSINKTSFSYSEVKSLLSIDWDWGNAVIAKEFIEYGYAKSGNLVLSNKAPSFPYISLQIKPADWINFIYFHAWLSSNVLDSVNIAAYSRDIFRNKFFAWHTLMVSPLKGLDISFGESVVYSDKLELVYLMPFMFYFFADDYLSNLRGKPGDANVQFFFSVSSKNHLKNTHIYGILFIDELTLRGLSGSIVPDNPDVLFDVKRLQIGYTAGASLTDLPVNNLSTTVEYTKIYPYVYGHHTPAQTYTNASYLMGHWMGHNADLLHLELNYRFFRGMQMNVWGEYIRKGSSTFEGQYKYPPPVFLFGLKNYYKYFGVNIKYELMHELNLETRFRLNITSNEETSGSFIDDKVNVISLSVYYGL